MLLQNLSQSDCGDNSCLFDGKGKGGMRTNGGCRCYQNYSSKIIDQYNQLEIDGEVGELANIITSEYYPCDERATLLARQIISNLSKFLVIKKGG